MLASDQWDGSCWSRGCGRLVGSSMDVVGCHRVNTFVDECVDRVKEGQNDIQNS